MSYDEGECASALEALTRELIRKNVTLATMESCTGGALASFITDTEGASAVFKGALVAYTNLSKELLGVPEETIDSYGVYSAETARAMAERARRFFLADVGAGVTGSFSNPDPANADSVPGEVYFAVADASGTECFKCRLPFLHDRPAYKKCVSREIARQILKKL